MRGVILSSLPVEVVVAGLLVVTSCPQGEREEQAAGDQEGYEQLQVKPHSLRHSLI